LQFAVFVDVGLPVVEEGVAFWRIRYSSFASLQATRMATVVRPTSAVSATLTCSCCPRRISGRRCRSTRRRVSGCWRRVVKCCAKTTSWTRRWRHDIFIVHRVSCRVWNLCTKSEV